jgi:exosortase family protein XrtF
LDLYNGQNFEVDAITNLVAEQSKDVLLFFNKNASTEKHSTQASIKLFYNSKYISRIVEGCNAISVIILYLAFIFAFTGKWKPTIGFLSLGAVAIYILNIVRIALLAVLFYNFPEYESFLHDILFPLIIYGFVFMLWFIWVYKFSIYAKK